MGGNFGRGFLLALAIAVCMILKGRIDWLEGWTLRSPFFTAALLMMLPGAFLASLPGRIRRRKASRAPIRWHSCILCFFGGLLLMLSAGLAGGGDGMMLAGICQGSISGWAFAALSTLSALITARLAAGRSNT